MNIKIVGSIVINNLHTRNYLLPCICQTQTIWNLQQQKYFPYKMQGTCTGGCWYRYSFNQREPQCWMGGRWPAPRPGRFTIEKSPGILQWYHRNLIGATFIVTMGTYSTTHKSLLLKKKKIRRTTYLKINSERYRPRLNL